MNCKARLAVHFQSIAEKFSPHDAVFSFNTSAELLDSALTAACSLHTAPTSIKSASSLRRKALAEITEDAGENQTVLENNETKDDDAISTGAKTVPTRPDAHDEGPTPPPPDAPTPSSTPSSTLRKSFDKALPPIPKSPKSGRRTENSREHNKETVRPSLEGRRSSSPARQPTSEGYERYDANGYKIKEKIGPRPSLESSDPAFGTHNSRPVSSLPATVRMPLRKAPPVKPVKNDIQPLESSRHQAVPASAPAKSSSFPFISPPFARPIPSPPMPLPTRPRTADSKSSAVTPEKRRLMKAVELRQKQLAAQKSAQEPGREGTLAATAETQAAKPEPKDEHSQSTGRADEGERYALSPTAKKEVGSGILRLESTDLSEEAGATVDASPISAPEASDGPSTQASSVSEVECLSQENKDSEGISLKTASPLTDDEGTPKAQRQSRELSFGVSDQVQHGSDTEMECPVMEHQQNDARTAIREATDPKEESTSDSGRDRQLLETAEFELKATRSGEGLTIGDGVAAFDSNAVMDDEHRLTNLEETTSKDVPESSNNSTELRISSQTPHTAFPRLHCHNTENVKPQEIPLPPISEDEEMRLSPQRASFTDESILQGVIPRESHATGLFHEDDERLLPSRASTVTRPSTADTVGDRRSIRPNRRHGLIEPIRRVSSGDNSDDQFLSDDSFMEELKCATVQEAKPIRVSRSPIAPEFPRPKSEHKTEIFTNPRSVSSPIDTTNTEDRKTLSPQISTSQAPRAVSLSQPRSVSPPEVSPPMLKKLGVSSGISQRIKALETLSSRPTSPSQALHSPTNSPPAFANLGSRKSSLRSRPGKSNRPPSPQSQSPTSMFDLSSPKLTAPKPYNQFVSVSVASKPGRSRPDSISVTAKIVRDKQKHTSEVTVDASEPRSIEIQRSPGKVESRTLESMPPPSKKPAIKRHTTAPSTSSTSTDHKRESFLSSRRDSIHSGSNGSRRGSDVALSRSTSEISLSGLTPEIRHEEKKESRRSRLLKRMSGISSASRRSIATALSPAPAREQPITEQPEPVVEHKPAPPAAVDIGDVNIQFPDTLVRTNSIPSSYILILVPLRLPIPFPQAYPSQSSHPLTSNTSSGNAAT